MQHSTHCFCHRLFSIDIRVRMVFLSIVWSGHEVVTVMCTNDTIHDVGYRKNCSVPQGDDTAMEIAWRARGNAINIADLAVVLSFVCLP